MTRLNSAKVAGVGEWMVAQMVMPSLPAPALAGRVSAATYCITWPRLPELSPAERAGRRRSRGRARAPHLQGGVRVEAGRGLI
jgi:hypothetical protein